MKFVMNERLKHRLTGVVVILSVAAIFVPAVMKRSNQHFEENINLSVRLPQKPTPPVAVAPSEKTLFQSVPVAKVTIPAVEEAPKNIQLSQAEPLRIKSSMAAMPSHMAEKSPVLTHKKVASLSSMLHPVEQLKPVVRKETRLGQNKKETYAIQLASFTQQSNAQVLVNRLRSKGYNASYNKSTGKQGDMYKVIVSGLNQRDEAQHVQKQLADNLQLNGFIIKAGVS